MARPAHHEGKRGSKDRPSEPDGGAVVGRATERSASSRPEHRPRDQDGPFDRAQGARAASSRHWRTAEEAGLLRARQRGRVDPQRRPHAPRPKSCLPRTSCTRPCVCAEHRAASRSSAHAHPHRERQVLFLDAFPRTRRATWRRPHLHMSLADPQKRRALHLGSICSDAMFWHRSPSRCTPQRWSAARPRPSRTDREQSVRKPCPLGSRTATADQAIEHRSQTADRILQRCIRVLPSTQRRIRRRPHTTPAGASAKGGRAVRVPVGTWLRCRFRGLGRGRGRSGSSGGRGAVGRWG